MSNSDIKNNVEDPDRYSNQTPDPQVQSDPITSQNKASPTAQNKPSSPQLTEMVNNINSDLSILYQDINKHINDQLDQVKTSSEDIESLMSNLNQQLKNSQKK